MHEGTAVDVAAVAEEGVVAAAAAAVGVVQHEPRLEHLVQKTRRPRGQRLCGG